MTEPVEVEASGETVGEAKWQALRELERLLPGVDKSLVRFDVLAEGERGLLGVGYSPARVRARADGVSERAEATSEAAGDARQLVAAIVDALGVECRVDVAEDDESVTVSCAGGDLGLLIGRHGQTIDAVQYLVNAIAHRGGGTRTVVVDAAGYRARRETTLGGVAERAAERALASGAPVELEPMSAAERKIVHVRLQDYPGVETASAGDEPGRYVVISPKASRSSGG